jgi:predicted DNA-binding transcriptional regulator AlpA
MTAPNARSDGQVAALPEDDLLTTDDVAALTRSPASTVRYWRHTGVGPRGFRIGRRVLYRRGEVLRWLAEQEAVDPADHDASLVLLRRR